MKIDIKEYDPNWPVQFQQIADELSSILKDLNPKIEHVGSTSVPGLAAKPIIDILVGLENSSHLDETIEPMIKSSYIYYPIYNSSMPSRRFYVGLKSKNEISRFKSIYTEGDKIPHDELHKHKLTHIHVWELGTSEWGRHIAFRDYLRNHPTIVSQYRNLKTELSLKSWKDGNEYNDAKDDFIKKEEAKAIIWYKGIIEQQLTKDKMN